MEIGVRHFWYGQTDEYDVLNGIGTIYFHGKDKGEKDLEPHFQIGIFDDNILRYGIIIEGTYYGKVVQVVYRDKLKDKFSFYVYFLYDI